MWIGIELTDETISTQLFAADKKWQAIQEMVNRIIWGTPNTFVLHISHEKNRVRIVSTLGIEYVLEKSESGIVELP